jgi:DNA-binding CsgD family transcriptional regulator
VAPTLVATPLTGRHADAAVLRSAYAQVLTGHARVALVSGEAGIGKTHLTTAVTGSLPGDPMIVTGNCLEIGADRIPYGPFAAVVRRLVRESDDAAPDDLTESVPWLGLWTGSLRGDMAMPGSSRVLATVLELLGRQASGRPLVVIIENLQWADPASRDLFVYLARNLRTERILLIGTWRTGELQGRHPARLLFAEMKRHPEVVSVDLGPLSLDDVAEHLARLRGRPVPRDMCEDVHRRSGGNPFFVEALSTDQPRRGVQELLLERVASLPSDAQHLLQIIAVAYSAVSQDVVTDVAQMPAWRLYAALRELIDRKYLVTNDDEYTVRYELIREAVYEDALPGQRRRLHARYAQALSVVPRPGDVQAAVERAEHWYAAGEADQAIVSAWSAADAARTQRDYDEQLRLLERVLHLWDRVEDPDRLLSTSLVDVAERATAAALAAGASRAGVAHSHLALRELDESTEPVRTAAVLADLALLRTRLAMDNTTEIRRSMQLVPPGVNDSVRCRVLAVAMNTSLLHARWSDARVLAREILVLTVPGNRQPEQWPLCADGMAMRAWALGVVARLDGLEGHSTAASTHVSAARRLARKAGDDHVLFTVEQYEVGALIHNGRLTEAADLARAAHMKAQRSGMARSRGAVLAAAGAEALALLGEWDQAVELAQAALADDPPPLFAARAHMALAEIALARGEIAAADRSHAFLEDVLAPGTFALHRLAYDRQLCLAALIRGDLDLAADVVQTALTESGEVLGTLPGAATLSLAATVQRVRRAVAPRDRNLRRRITEDLAAIRLRADSLLADRPGLAGYRFTVIAEQTGALVDWDRAVAAWRGAGQAFHLATALTSASEVALASSNRSGARLRLREASAIADALAAEPLSGRIHDLAVRARLHVVDGQPEAARRFGLTPREVDVLRLLARGRSNREISVELFISVNTVAAHVAHIFTKLSVKSRAEAAAVAHSERLIG